MIKTLAYRAFDVCTLGRGVARTICNERIRLPARWCRWYSSEYEPQTFAFLRAHCKPAATVLDIGAHLGLFTVTMARLVGPRGHVFSFEPTPQTRNVLQKTVRLNECQSVVEVREEAVSGSTGSADFFDTGAAVANANSLIETDRSLRALHVRTIRLDDFVQERSIPVDCLKIDVEGAELELLRGGRETLCRYRPCIFLSVHPEAVARSGGSLAELWQLVEAYGMIMIQHGKPVLQAEFCNEQSLFDVEIYGKYSAAKPDS